MRVLQSLLAFSGNAPPQLAVMRRLVEEGHEVRALAHEAARHRIEATGAQVVPFRRMYPDMDLSRPETDPVKDWGAKSPIAAAARMRDRGIVAPMPDAAADARELIDEWSPDVVLFDWLLLGIRSWPRLLAYRRWPSSTVPTPCPRVGLRHWAPASSLREARPDGCARRSCARGRSVS